MTSKWGADPKTLRTSALALCYTTAEFCSPVWERSCHAAKVDTELNEACRIITGLLKPTPLQTVYRLAGIAPPSIRRRCQSRTQKHIQETDPRHPLHQYQECQRRLISRKSFMTMDSLHPTNAARFRIEQWEEKDDSPPNNAVQDPCESLPRGVDLPRRDWVALNRARSGVGRTLRNQRKWGHIPSAHCPCGHPQQTMDHIRTTCTLGPHCTKEDLHDVNDQALRWLQYWRDKI